MSAILQGQSQDLQLTPDGRFDRVLDGHGNEYQLANLRVGAAKFGTAALNVISATCQAGDQRECCTLYGGKPEQYLFKARQCV